MGEDFLNSSDSVRSGGPLKYAKTVTFSEPLRLHRGGSLPEVTVAYETYGELNTDASNAVLICHALSGDSHVARHDASDDPGWWDILVGPGKAVDTDKYFVICPNILGGCRGTTGPNSINPATKKRYGRDFPAITIQDMVEVQRRLVEHLGISKLLAVIGGSVGGHQVLAWATMFPEKVRAVAAIATSPRLTSQALAFDVVGRNAILRDPNFRDGQYYDAAAKPNVGLAIARMIGHITYLSPEAMREKFGRDRHAPRNVDTDFEKQFSVGSYLGYQGDKFVERFDANSYVTLSLAMDLFDMGDTPEQLVAAFAKTTCRWLVVSYTSDWLFPPEQSQQIVNALIANDKPVSYCNVTSSSGHDAFLLEDSLETYGGLVRAFLANTAGATAAQAQQEKDAYHWHSHTSIFHGRRLDYDRIVELIPHGASVLDLGCGTGVLLERLKRRGHKRLVGVELSEHAVLAGVHRGLDIIHANLDEGLPQFYDKQFDVVILSQTLQAVRDVEGVMADMLRVGHRCIVTFPNFAYHKLRKMLAEQGKAPEAPGILHYKWYNTPNIRFLSIADFEDFCREKGIKVNLRIALDTEEGREVTEDPNLNADLAIFVLSK